MSESYIFSTADGGKTFTRKLYGFDALCYSYASEAQGLFFYTGSILVQLPPSLTREELELRIRSSWISLRHASPAIGCTSSFSKATHDWTVIYTVPQSQTDADIWARDTIKWHDEEKPFIERDVELAVQYWDPAHGTATLILCVSPVNKADGRWMLSIQGPHGAIDGRGCMFLYDHFLTTLNKGLSDATAPMIADLEWGKETVRLCGAGVVLTGEFDVNMAMEPTPAGPPPSGFIPFLPPFVENPASSTISSTRLVTLDNEQTARFRAVCKLHGRTVTQVIDAAFAIADVEAVLQGARAHGEEHVKSVVGVYEQATHWLIALSFKDQRPTYPNHSKVFGPEGSALFALDGYDLAIDMSKIRQAVQLDKETFTIKRETSQAVFWDGVVENYVEARKRQKVDHASYIARETAKQSLLSAISTAPMNVRAAVTSSIGHIEALGALCDFTPDVRAGVVKKNVVVEQYNGELSFCFHTASKYQTDAEMDVMVEVFKGWLVELI